MSPELLVNSLFIKRLNKILFEKRQETSNRGLQHALFILRKKTVLSYAYGILR